MKNFEIFKKILENFDKNLKKNLNLKNFSAAETWLFSVLCNFSGFHGGELPPFSPLFGYATCPDGIVYLGILLF